MVPRNILPLAARGCVRGYFIKKKMSASSPKWKLPFDRFKKKKKLNHMHLRDCVKS